MRTFRWIKHCGGKYQFSGVGKTARCPKCNEEVNLESAPYCIQYQHLGRQTIKSIGLKKDAEAFIAAVKLAQYTDTPLPNKEPPIMWEEAVRLFTAHKLTTVKPSTLTAYSNAIKYLSPTFGRMAMHKITPAMFINHRAVRLETVSASIVNTELTVLRNMYGIIKKTHSVRSYPKIYAAFDDLSGIELLKETAKDRYLTTPEIVAAWKGFDTLPKNVRDSLKLILLTGQRPGEVAGIVPAEISGNWWTIPPERSKNGIENRVYLTDYALKLAKKKPSVRNTLSNTLQKRREAGKLFNIQPFTPHDLRRTMATLVSEMGYSDSVIDRILNHTKQGVIKVYNRNNYDNEKKELLIDWEKKLLNIVGISSEQSPKSNEKVMTTEIIAQKPNITKCHGLNYINYLKLSDFTK